MTAGCGLAPCPDCRTWVCLQHHACPRDRPPVAAVEEVTG